MGIRKLGAAIALGFCLAAGAVAAQTALKPASPQPSGLKSGLKVNYAYPADVRTLDDARSSLSSDAKTGKPLAGLTYPDKGRGALALTSRSEFTVAAKIQGYIRFDKPGVWQLTVFSNDGVDINVGGFRVGYKNERTPCSRAGRHKVTVPKAGWYAVDAVWFQRLGTSCLEMEWTPPGGKRQAVPNSAFGYK